MWRPANQFYADTATEPPLLLRMMDDNIGQLWDKGNRRWVGTRLLMDAFAGHNFYVESISEAEARKLAPAAFA